MSRITTALVDLSGTLHIEDAAISGAVEALERLRRLTDVRFVTNTTKESTNNLFNRLIRCGFRIEKSEIFSSLSAARRLIDDKRYRPMLFLEEEALEDFQDLDLNNPNAVVVGLAPSQFHYDKLNDAFRLLLNEGTELIAIHKGRYYRRGDGLALGPGPFVSGLEYATGKKATVCGKPEKKFFELAVKTLDGDRAMGEAVMIGDDVQDDVLGGLEAGMKAVLVQTGKYRQGDECKVPESRRNVARTFVEAVDLIQNGLLK